MIEAKDITVSTPCLFPDEQPIWMLRESAEQFGWQLRPYGLGEGPYRGWVHLKIHCLLKEAQTCPTSHLLYTDARDAFFIAGPEEVADKYNHMGSPALLLSAQHEMFPGYEKWYEGLEWDRTRPFPYVSPPGMLCDAKALANALTWMLGRVASGAWDQMPDDDPQWWLNYMKDSDGRLVIDHDCQIFLNCGSHTSKPDGMWDYLSIVDGRVRNNLTRQWPAVLHFNNGYSHPLEGKWERIKPYWRALGHKSNPPWEREGA